MYSLFFTGVYLTVSGLKIVSLSLEFETWTALMHKRSATVIRQPLCITQVVLGLISQ